MAKALAVVLLACLAAPALASYCTSYYGSTSTSRTCSVFVSYGQRIAAATNSAQSEVIGAYATGDTTLAVRLPGSTAGSTAWLYNDDSCGSTQSYIPYRCVPYSGTYTIEGSCFSCGTSCSASIYYTVDTPSTTCTTSTGLCTTGSPGTVYVNSASISNCGSSSSNGASSSSNGYSSGGSGGYYGSTVDVTNKGWAAPAALAAAIGLTQIILWAVYGTRVASDMACCGCAPTAADRALPSILDSPAGSMHMHTFALVILLPLSAILVFVAMCVDGYEVVRDQRDAMYGAFGAHQKSTRYTYDDLCPKQQGNVYTSNNRMCPSLRTAGAMTFIGELLGLLAVLAAVIKFATSSPYQASGKTAFSGGKPVIPRASCRLIEFYSVSISMATIMWIAAGHGALSWFFSYNLSDAGYVQLGPSWALLLVGSVIAIFPAMIARREALRDQPAAGAQQQGVVPGAKTNTPVAAQPAMQQPGMQQPYGGGAVYGGGVPMQQQQMPQYAPQPGYAAQPGLTGYAPQYAAQNAPPPVYAGAPPAYAVAAPSAQPVVVVQQPMGAVVRVPVQPPPGLALPPGAILYSNGDVCDAGGNVLGVVPGMRPAQPVIVAGTA